MFLENQRAIRTPSFLVRARVPGTAERRSSEVVVVRYRTPLPGLLRHRRSIAWLSALWFARCCLTVEARTLDLTKPEEVIAAEIREACPKDDSHPYISYMTGQLYSIRVGEPNRHLFNVQAVNTRACAFVRDPVKGPGYRSVGREIMLYLDPANDALLEIWTNPWTEERVPVIPMLNDPVNMPAPKYARDSDGHALARWEGKIVGGLAVTRRVTPFFRDSPLAGSYQSYVGGQYAVLEMSVTTVVASVWLDTAAPTPVPVTSVWTRLSPWLPWMKMGGREGLTLLNGVWTTGTLGDVPEPLRSYIRERQPRFAAAPPLNDERANVSSWDGIKRAIDAQRESSR